LSSWELEAGRAMGRADISQRGNGEYLRNESLDGTSFEYDSEWILPHRGNLKFDYAAPPPPRGSILKPYTLISESSMMESLSMLRSSPLGPEVKVRAFRAISHRLAVSTDQLKSFIFAFKDAKSRRDVFVTLIRRVLDLRAVLGRDILHASKVFTNEDRTILQEQFGYLNLTSPLYSESQFYRLRMDVYEQRQIIAMLVGLAVKEPGVNMPDAHLNGQPFCVPFMWETEVPPKKAVFETTYKTFHVHTQGRIEATERFCGWLPQ